MLDKRMTVDDIVDQISDGMTIGIGGWATRRKPMALIRAIARSSLKDLTVMAGYGGMDIGLLAATGKIKKLVFAFASLDHYPLEPHFRNARQAGSFEVLELDEGMYHWGLRAGAMKLPFLPTRVGIGTTAPTALLTLSAPTSSRNRASTSNLSKAPMKMARNSSPCPRWCPTSRSSTPTVPTSAATC